MRAPCRHTLRRNHPRRPEHGAVAILVALCMVSLLVAVAMVLDFGIVRVDRQSNKSSADAAASAGLRGLDTGDGLAHPFPGVCQALRYLGANNPRFSDLAGSWSDGVGTPTLDGCTDTTLYYQPCLPGDPTSWARFEGTASSGRITVRIQSGYDLSDGNFAEETISALQADAGDSDQQGCDQLAVIVSETREPGLGSVATTGTLVSRIRSVGRVVVDNNGLGAVALLLLERNDCAVLDADGAGANILVHDNGPMPGMIHADSLGDGQVDVDGDGDVDSIGGDCETNKVLNGNHPDGIVAEASQVGSKPAVLSVRALSGEPGATAGNASDPDPDVIAMPGPPFNQPVGGGLITRSPVDNRWLNGVKIAVSSAATNWVSPPPTALTPAPTVAHETNCTGGSGPANAATFTAETVVFDCTDAGKNYPNITLAAKKVIFTHGVYVTSDFKMPLADEVYVRGVPGGDAITVKNNASFQMHFDGRTESRPPFVRQVCKETAIDGRAKLVIGAGSIGMGSSTAHMQMCNTATIMMGGQALACLPASTPTLPSTNLCDSFIQVTGGALDWTAPNQSDLPAAQTEWDQLEDLALWSEAEGVSALGHRIMGGGQMHLTGIFMLPNANSFRIGGGGDQAVENSQYVARRLKVNGTGTLDMKPHPANSFTIPIIGGFQLVR